MADQKKTYNMNDLNRLIDSGRSDRVRDYIRLNGPHVGGNFSDWAASEADAAQRRKTSKRKPPAKAGRRSTPKKRR